VEKWTRQTKDFIDIFKVQTRNHEYGQWPESFNNIRAFLCFRVGEWEKLTFQIFLSSNHTKNGPYFPRKMIFWLHFDWLE
jgi:hypothetical protein